MKLSMYTGYIRNAGFSDFEEGLSYMYTQGIRYGDIVDAELNEIPLFLYVEYLRACGMEPNALVATKNITAKNAKVRRRNMAELKGYIDLMNKYGIPYLMPAPSVKDAKSKDEFYALREIMIESLNELTEYAKGSGVKICMENQSVTTRPDSKIEDISYILSGVPNLLYTLDAGNFYCVGDDVLKAYDLFSGRMVYAHFKDWTEDKYGSFVRENMPRFDGCVLGSGVIPLETLASKMKQDGFDVCITLEINSSSITPEKLADSAKFLRDIF